MKLPIRPPLLPMEARLVSEPPTGPEWQYEPKWDGFRCLAFRNGADVYLQSKSGQPLARYFPDLVHVLKQLKPKRFVLDGEIVIPLKGRSSFDQLLQRIHPARSRVEKLVSEFPALFIVFDLLSTDRGQSLVDVPLQLRRPQLERFAKQFLTGEDSVKLSPVTTKLATARKWFAAPDSGLDGIVAKRLDLGYSSGSRDAMQKVKHRHTADCVVGGFRFAEGKKAVGSLLLGLYDDKGVLNHVGFTSSFSAKERSELFKQLKPFRRGEGFTGKAPGGPSRWSTKKSTEWEPLRPKLVVEVEYDNFNGERFRHGTHFVRFRPDKLPSECTYGQLRTTGTKLRLLSA